MAKSYHVPGPCTVSWGGTSLNTTKAGIFIRPSTTWIPVSADEGGSAPIDFIFGGKSCVVEFIILDMAQFLAAQPVVAGLLSNIDGGGDNLIGRMVFDGDTGGVGKELVITENDGLNTWKAAWAAPTEPSQIVLSSVQENQMPLAFLIAQDADGKLFQTLPSYL